MNDWKICKKCSLNDCTGKRKDWEVEDRRKLER